MSDLSESQLLPEGGGAEWGDKTGIEITTTAARAQTIVLQSLSEVGRAGQEVVKRKDENQNLRCCTRLWREE